MRSKMARESSALRTSESESSMSGFRVTTVSARGVCATARHADQVIRSRVREGFNQGGFSVALQPLIFAELLPPLL